MRAGIDQTFTLTNRNSLCHLTMFFIMFFITSIAKVNSGRSIPKAEVTLANSQAEVTLANFYISVLFHAIV